MTLTTLVIGPSAAVREAAIANELEPGLATAILLEGLPSSAMALDNAAAPHEARPSPFLLQISRIAPSCLCCTGNLTMRVTLNRILRKAPQRLYIGLASPAHLERIRHFLSQAPYDHLLQLTQDLHA